MDAAESFLEEIPTDGPPPGPPATREAAPPARTARPKQSEPRPAVSRSMREIADSEDQDLRTYLDTLIGDQPLKITIIRKKPLVGPNDEPISGACETVEEKIDEDYVDEMWGGGTFDLKILRMNPQGSFVYFKTRTIKIAGEPKIRGRILQRGAPVQAGAVAGGDDLTSKTLDMYERSTERERARADQLERELRKGTGGLDIAALQALQAPLLAQIAEQQAKIGEMQLELVKLASAPPPKDAFRDTLLERAVNGDNSRIETLRETYESRINAQRERYEDRMDRMRDDHQNEIKRLEERFRDDIRRLEDRHEREIKAFEKSSETSGKGTELGYQSRIDGLQEQLKRADRDLTAAQTKIAALEAKKDQTIGEKADELIKVKEALDGIGGGDSSDDGPWYTKVIDAFGNSQAVLDLIAKVGKGAGAGPDGGGDQPPPVGVPFYLPDGRLVVRNPDDSYSVLPNQQGGGVPTGKKRRRVQRPGQPAQQGAAAAQGGDDDFGGLDMAGQGGGEEPAAGEIAAPPPKKPTDKEIKAAVAFIENAVKSNKADAESFARGMRNLVPGEILQYIQAVGPEKLLASVKLDAGSPLTTQNGRNFVRKVFATLFEGGELS